jgi:oxygen-independent coproporphyrinogen III oxidase
MAKQLQNRFPYGSLNQPESQAGIVSLGIYIHIPFCRAKCSYCHFISMPYQDDLAIQYKTALISEIETHPAASDEVNSIYFGGGTPTVAPEDHIAEILEACRRKFHVTEDCEVSMEANPGSASADGIATYRKAGINRISVGAQSFVDPELSAVGRIHKSSMISDTVSLARGSGLNNISLDLMLGLPGQTAESWNLSLNEADSLSVPHVSVYMLDLDEQCPLGAQVANGSVALPCEDLISDLYLETIRFFSSRGYLHYEISNFAKPGYECRHNLKYWNREAFRGFGVGSHSFDLRSRYANSSQISEYLGALQTGAESINWREPVTDEQALQETLFLGLRLTKGIDLNPLRSGRFGDLLIKYENSLTDLYSRGLIEKTGSTVRLTESGMLLSNEIFQRFV